MNKRLLLTIFLVLLVLVGIAVWKSTASSAAIEQAARTESIRPNPTQDKNMQHKNADQILQESLSTQLKSVQRQPGNITQFINTFKANCQLENCDAALAQALANYPDQKFAQTVQNLLKRMPQYEQQMQSTVLSTAISPKERFDAIWKLREQTLGKDEAALGFGQEREYADYRFAYAELKQNTQLNPEQRLAALETLQQKHPRLMEQESNFARYEQAVQLLDEKQPTAETQRLKQELQQRYLSQQEQLDLQFKQQREQQQQQKVDQYQQALKQLQQEMQPLKSQLSETEWQKHYQQRLESLRSNLFP
ncbi:lipase secretion chaperone [Acinetobacter haemolyticus]|uniref:lipase secretion chaperone n=1 Tax=Acinetobacter haemolyticus TaxID=29430 RepID=UPI000D69F2FA|nr:lipase secretion chaperone [Acinetobacter haemolyticus]